VFVIERAEALGPEAANRLLKTLEEPASFVHLILTSDRPAEVLETVRSRCQSVRFDGPPLDELAAQLRAQGTPTASAQACARLGLGDASRARELASAEGLELRAKALLLVRGALAGEVARSAPWEGVIAAVRSRGEQLRTALEERAAAELALTASRERKRVEADWAERVRRGRRRVETRALELALDVIEAWLLDLIALSLGADELVRSCDMLAELRADRARGRGGEPAALRRALELAEDTRTRLRRNVSEDLALEALAYRLEDALAG